jgi:hypothetical protein
MFNRYNVPRGGNSTAAHITKDLGPVLKQFSSERSAEVSISDVQPVASYSWIDEKTPTIAVPGTTLATFRKFITCQGQLTPNSQVRQVFGQRFNPGAFPKTPGWSTLIRMPIVWVPRRLR